MKPSATCPNCGATNSIPATGLEIVCEYCGHTRPVPDVEKRKKRLAQQAEARRKAEERARQRQLKEQAKAQARQEQERRQTRRAVGRTMGCLFRTLMGLLPVAIGLVVLHSHGVLDVVVGEPGTKELQKEILQLKEQGYRQLGPARAERFFVTPKKIYLDLKQGHCYALALGAGKPLRLVHLVGQRAFHPQRFSTTVFFCAKKTQARRCLVSLDAFGRFSWALFQRSEGSAPGSKGAGSTVRFRSGCNVRAAPLVKAAKVGLARPDQDYPLLEQRGKWHRIRLVDGTEGWAACRPAP